MDLKGRIEEVNGGTVRLHKLSNKEEILGRNAIDLVAERDRERIRENFRKVIQQDVQVTSEYHFLTGGGDEFLGEMSASLIKDSSGRGTGFFTMVRDVTQRKKEEEEIRLKAELLDNANDCIYVIDMDGFRHIYANDTCCSLHGYTHEEFLNLRLEQLVPPEYRQRDNRAQQ